MISYAIKNKETAIMSFKGENLFLSNFYEGKVFTYRGYKFTNTEAPFHAEKLGRKVLMRKDWDQVKDQVMYDVCYAKFTQDPVLKAKLLATGDRELIEGNTHGDRCWGMTYSQKYDTWIGENRLGIVLMQLREDLRHE